MVTGFRWLLDQWWLELGDGQEDPDSRFRWLLDQWWLER